MISKFHYNNLYSDSPVPCGEYLLYQVGELYCNADTEVLEHRQYCCEFTYAVEGSGSVQTDGRRQAIHAGDCLFTPAAGRHAIFSDRAAPLRFKFIGFSPLPDTHAEQHIRMLGDYARQSPSFAPSFPEADGIFRQIFREVGGTDSFFGELIGLHISELVIGILRAYEKSTPKKLPPEIGSDSMLVFHIVNYLDARVYDIKNLYELEEAFNYSYNYMSAVFRRIMKMPVAAYFRKIRMEAASTLLRTGNYSVTEVSEKLHYSSIHTFSRSFTRYFGHSPTRA